MKAGRCIKILFLISQMRMLERPSSYAKGNSWSINVLSPTRSCLPLILGRSLVTAIQVSVPKKQIRIFMKPLEIIARSDTRRHGSGCADLRGRKQVWAESLQSECPQALKEAVSLQRRGGFLEPPKGKILTSSERKDKVKFRPLLPRDLIWVGLYQINNVSEDPSPVTLAPSGARAQPGCVISGNKWQCLSVEIFLANFRTRLKSKLDFFWRVIFKGFYPLTCVCKIAALPKGREQSWGKK